MVVSFDIFTATFIFERMDEMIFVIEPNSEKNTKCLYDLQHQIHSELNSEAKFKSIVLPAGCKYDIILEMDEDFEKIRDEISVECEDKQNDICG